MASRGVKIAYDFKKTSKLSPAQIDQANEIFEKHRVTNFVELGKLKEVLRDIAMKKPGWEVNEKNLRDFISGLDKQFKTGKVLQPEFLQIYDQYLELTETEEWTPEKLDFLVPRLRDKSMGLEIRNRKSMFKTFEMVFRGHDMVEWLFQKHLSKTREEAIYVGGLLLKSGRLLPIPPPTSASTLVEFKDDQSFWRFIEDDKELKDIEEKKKKEKATTRSSTKLPALGLELIKGGRRKEDPLASARYIQFSRTSSEVPTAVQHLITYLNENALEVPGIFRVSGQHEEMQNLKKLYDKGKYPLPELAKYEINTVAGVLKLWLRELPEPLLTFELYEPFIAATSITDSEDERLECIRKVLKRLPTGNFVILNFLVKFLVSVAAKSEITKMTPSNLAIVFTPTCLRPEKETIEIMFGHSTSANSLFETFIEKYSDLFLPGGRKVAVKGEQAKYVFGTLRRAKKLLILQDLQEQEDLENELASGLPSPKSEGSGGGEAGTVSGTPRRSHSVSAAEGTSGPPLDFVNLNESASSPATISSPSSASKEDIADKVVAAAAKQQRHRRTPSTGKPTGHRRTSSSSTPGTTSSAWFQFFQQPAEGSSAGGDETSTPSTPVSSPPSYLPPPIPMINPVPAPPHVSIQLTPRTSGLPISPRSVVLPPLTLPPPPPFPTSTSSPSSPTSASSAAPSISPRQLSSPRTIVYVSPRATMTEDETPVTPSS